MGGYIMMTNLGRKTPKTSKKSVPMSVSKPKTQVLTDGSNILLIFSYIMITFKQFFLI